MAEHFDWIEIRGPGNTPVGMIGFLGDDAVVVAAFYEDPNGSEDGPVRPSERAVSARSPIGVEGRAVTQVVMQAKVDIDILNRDPSFGPMAARMFVEFGRSVVMDGIYAAYFGRGVRTTGRGVSTRVTRARIKEFVIRKGHETAAHAAFRQTSAV